jgi:hypothetical protein
MAIARPPRMSNRTSVVRAIRSGGTNLNHALKVRTSIRAGDNASWGKTGSSTLDKETKITRLS